ncbi:putative reverse transcriptase domain-containing protein [Tanacetum coccineum]
MTTMNQGMRFAEIEQMVTKRVVNAIETIVIYEIKTRMACESMRQIKRQEDELAENTSNKRKWEGDHKGSSSQQQNKEPKTKCSNRKRFGHQTRDCRTPILRAKQRPSVAKQKAEVTCCECGMLGHYKSNCPMCKFPKHVNEYWKERALKNSCVVANNVDV